MPQQTILGVSAGFHDAAVAVIRNDKIDFASHAERYSRVKNDKFLNSAILDEALDGQKNVDILAYYENPYVKWLRMWLVGQKPVFNSAQTIAADFSLSAKRYANFSHHKSHAAAGFQTSIFDSAIVVVIDAIGEWDTASVWYATYNKHGEAKYQKLWHLQYPNSIGLFYSAVTQKVGLKPNEDEYILMGMAAYGVADPNFKHQFFNGLKSRHNLHIGMPDGILADGVSDFDLAASAQDAIEAKLSKIFAIAEYFAAKVKTQNLVYMGGVALNCSANSAVIHKGLWRDVWIMPSPGDAGSALGAAALAYKKRLIWPGPYLGHAIGHKYPVDAIVKELIQNQIVGVAAGRAEFGPRSLGNRSLLADPRGLDTKDRVNEIKQRQKFRPFAPVILEEYADQYFDMRPAIRGKSLYMQFTVPCRTPELFPAIAHADGTSRIQTVGKRCPYGIRKVLEKWHAATGCPMLLNTSLNVKGDPIVNTVYDARLFEETYGVKVCLGQ